MIYTHQLTIYGNPPFRSSNWSKSEIRCSHWSKGSFYKWLVSEYGEFCPDFGIFVGVLGWTLFFSNGGRMRENFENLDFIKFRSIGTLNFKTPLNSIFDFKRYESNLRKSFCLLRNLKIVSVEIRVDFFFIWTYFLSNIFLKLCFCYFSNFLMNNTSWNNIPLVILLSE